MNIGDIKIDVKKRRSYACIRVDLAATGCALSSEGYRELTGFISDYIMRNWQHEKIRKQLSITGVSVHLLVLREDAESVVDRLRGIIIKNLVNVSGTGGGVLAKHAEG